MTNSVAIYTLIVGLICPFTQVARGQQSDPAQPAPATSSCLKRRQNSSERSTSERELTVRIGKNFGPVRVSN
jgi:hypothetical protein